MHSFEGPATTTTGVTISAKTSSSTDDNKNTVMGLIGQEDSQDSTSPALSGDHFVKEESKASEMEHAVAEGSLPAIEPLYPSGQSSRPDPGLNTVESVHRIMERHQGIHLRHGSVDSAYPEFTPNIISSTSPSQQLRRRLQVSLSWPTEKFRVTRPPLMKNQHGCQGHEPSALKEARLKENNNEQMAAATMIRHVRHVELPHMERHPYIEASSPTQEISQILRETRLRSPPPGTDIDVRRRFSFDEQFQHRPFGHQVFGDHTPTCTVSYTVTDPVSPFQGPHSLESSVLSHEGEKSLRRFSFDEQFQHVSSSHQQGELTPQLGSMQYPTTSSGHPLQSPPGDRLDSSAPSREGERLSWNQSGASAAVRPKTYPYHFHRRGAVGAPHLRSVGKFCSLCLT